MKTKKELVGSMAENICKSYGKQWFWADLIKWARETPDSDDKKAVMASIMRNLGGKDGL